MTQQVIDGILYSPVLAHSLRRGDLIMLAWGACRIRRNTSRTGSFIHADVTVCDDGGETWLKMFPNEPILRAVGAGVGGIA